MDKQIVEEEIDKQNEISKKVWRAGYNKAIENVKKLSYKFYTGQMLTRVHEELDKIKRV